SLSDLSAPTTAAPTILAADGQRGFVISRDVVSLVTIKTTTTDLAGTILAEQEQSMVIKDEGALKFLIDPSRLIDLGVLKEQMDQIGEWKGIRITKAAASALQYVDSAERSNEELEAIREGRALVCAAVAEQQGPAAGLAASASMEVGSRFSSMTDISAQSQQDQVANEKVNKENLAREASEKSAAKKRKKEEDEAQRLIRVQSYLDIAARGDAWKLRDLGYLRPWYKDLLTVSSVPRGTLLVHVVDAIATALESVLQQRAAAVPPQVEQQARHWQGEGEEMLETAFQVEEQPAERLEWDGVQQAIGVYETVTHLPENPMEVYVQHNAEAAIYVDDDSLGADLDGSILTNGSIMNYDTYDLELMDDPFSIYDGGEFIIPELTAALLRLSLPSTCWLFSGSWQPTYIQTP
ncbi:hypothetical protein B484DRAFT_406731, partial [Ochromonadaceae sp. CCMP2298]